MNKSIVIFASGSGSNAEAIAHHFRENDLSINIKGFWTNRPNAGALERAQKLGINSHVFNRSEFQNGKTLLLLQQLGVDLGRVGWILMENSRGLDYSIS